MIPRDTMLSDSCTYISYYPLSSFVPTSLWLIYVPKWIYVPYIRKWIISVGIYVLNVRKWFISIGSWFARFLLRRFRYISCAHWPFSVSSHLLLHMSFWNESKFVPNNTSSYLCGFSFCYMRITFATYKYSNGALIMFVGFSCCGIRPVYAPEDCSLDRWNFPLIANFLVFVRNYLYCIYYYYYTKNMAL